MLYENKEINIPYILSEAAQEAYRKIKALILKIFSLLKKQEKEKDLKEQFYDSYIDFARKLDQEGYYEESYSYMAICSMYYRLMDRPEVLMAHEGFFMDLFKAFDDLLYTKMNNPDGYDEKYIEFEDYSMKMQEYYYGNLAVPSPHFNKETLNKITSNLSGDLK